MGANEHGTAEFGNQNLGGLSVLGGGLLNQTASPSIVRHDSGFCPNGSFAEGATIRGQNGGRVFCKLLELNLAS